MMHLNIFAKISETRNMKSLSSVGHSFPQALSEAEIDEVNGGNVGGAIRMVAIGAAAGGVAGALVGAGVAYFVFFY